MADDDGEGGQQQRRMTRSCEIGRQTTKGKDKSGRQETAETRSGNDGCDSGRWQRLTTTVAGNDYGKGRKLQWQTTKAVDDDGMQDQAGDYKGEGGEQMANNNGIRQKADKPAGQRV